jgi:hypothetical protein
MAETLTIRTASSTEVVNIASVGPQGPKGDKGDPGEVAGLPLTTQGDTLYRGAAANERLAIGTAGQILKVVAGEPAWANESGAVVSVNGETGTVVLDAADVGAAPATGIDPTAISGTAVVDSDARLSDARTPTSHTHGNLTNDGKLGSTSGLPVVTTTAGAVTTLALGTANQVFRVNSGATGVEFGAGFDAASPPAIGNTTPNTGAFTTLSANNGALTASAPVLNLSQTWNNAAVTFTGILATFTNTASNAASRLIDLRVGADSFFSVNRSGTITGVVASGGTLLTSSGSGAFDINASGGARIRFAPSGVGGRMLLWSGTGKYQFFPSAATANTSLGLFVSTEGTNNVMALENATNPQTFRIYNTYTSATNFERLNVRWASNELIIDAEAGSAGGTLRGIKLGSAATSLLGFFGATPVVQQAAVADATDAATAITQLNDLLAAMRTLGLIAT